MSEITANNISPSIDPNIYIEETDNAPTQTASYTSLNIRSKIQTITKITTRALAYATHATALALTYNLINAFRYKVASKLCWEICIPASTGLFFITICNIVHVGYRVTSMIQQDCFSSSVKKSKKKAISERVTPLKILWVIVKTEVKIFTKLSIVATCGLYLSIKPILLCTTRNSQEGDQFILLEDFLQLQPQLFPAKDTILAIFGLISIAL